MRAFLYTIPGKLSIITNLGQEKDNSITNCLWFNSLGIYYQPSDRIFPRRMMCPSIAEAK